MKIGKLINGTLFTHGNAIYVKTFDNGVICKAKQMGVCTGEIWVYQPKDLEVEFSLTTIVGVEL